VREHRRLQREVGVLVVGVAGWAREWRAIACGA
jgi:hypothetical protein